MSFLTINKVDDTYNKCKPYKVVIYNNPREFRPLSIKDVHTVFDCTQEWNIFTYKFDKRKLVFNPALQSCVKLSFIKKIDKKRYAQIIRKFPNQFKFIKSI